MLKSKMLASGILLAAISLSVPAGLLLKQDALSSREAALRETAQQNVALASEAVPVQYAMELSEKDSQAFAVGLSNGVHGPVVTLPQDGQIDSTQTPAISQTSPVVQSYFSKIEEEKAASSEQKQQTVYYDTSVASASTGVAFDITKTIFPVTPEEVEMLMYVVQAEAGGGTLEGKRIVTLSITNRVLASTFPNTLYEVLHSRRQFSTIQNYYSKKKVPDATTIQAVQEVLMGACEDHSQNCMYFYCTAYPVAESVKNWFENDLVYLYTIGCDRFFTDPS